MSLGAWIAPECRTWSRAPSPAPTTASHEAADLLGTPGFVATAEDLVVAKLEWAAASDSDRQRRDVLGMVRVAVDLDEGYIDRWVTALGLGEAWRAIRDEARVL
jgi:hypothetical protein